MRDVWRVVSDPEHMPRWWPKTTRVENVSGQGKNCSWTQVLETKDGRGVRADYRCTSSAEPERFIFEQLIENSPFERILRRSIMEVTLEPVEGETQVAIANEQRLRGMSRLGSPMVRRATGRILNAALDGLEQAVRPEK